MQSTFEHSIVYTNKGKVTINDVAESLIANEQLIKIAASILESLYSGLDVRAEVYFKQATHSSPLQEIFGISLFTVFQKDLEKDVPHIIENLTGEHIPKQYDSLVSIVVFLLLYFGADFIFSKIKNKKSVPIGAGLTQTINVAGDFFNLPPEKIVSALEEGTKGTKRQQLISAVKGVITPARKESGAKITGNGALEITAEAIADFPSDVDLEMEDDIELQEPHQNVCIELRATDKDKNKTGWAGIIKDVLVNRLKMEVYPTISLDKLYGKEYIYGDVLLVSRKQPNGLYKPYKFYLLEIHEENHS